MTEVLRNALVDATNARAVGGERVAAMQDADSAMALLDRFGVSGRLGGKKTRVAKVGNMVIRAIETAPHRFTVRVHAGGRVIRRFTATPAIRHPEVERYA